MSVNERKHRTFGAGVTFGTDVGVGATAFWENRNLFGKGETLLARLSYSAPRQDAELTFSKTVPRLQSEWHTSLLAENEDTDAFAAQSIGLGFGIKRDWFGGALETNADIKYQYSDITDADGSERTFSLISLPLSATLNTENDPLNPTRGHRARFSATPYFGDRSFTRVSLGGASRLAFGKEDSTIVAGRALLGATYGLASAELPATERLYAGGGGSVRGYAYQEAGPLDGQGNP